MFIDDKDQKQQGFGTDSENHRSDSENSRSDRQNHKSASNINPGATQRQPQRAPYDNSFNGDPFEDNFLDMDSNRLFDERPSAFETDNGYSSRRLGTKSFLRKYGLIGFGVVALSFLIGMFIASTSTNNVVQGDIPVVSSLDTIKEKPTDVEGMKIDNLDKSVYGVLSDDETEDLLAGSDPNLEKPIIIEPDTDYEIKKIPNPPEAKVEVVKKVVIVKKKPVKKKVVKKKPVKEVVAKPQKIKKVVLKSLPKPTPPAGKKVILNEISSNYTKYPTARIVGQKNGWVVQLSSGKSESNAIASLRGLQKKYPSIRSATFFIEQTTVTGITYYRLQAVGYKNRAEATRVCSAIKSKGGDCLVKSS